MPSQPFLDSNMALWAPFPTESDLEFAERVVAAHSTESDVKKELNFWLKKAVNSEENVTMQT